MRSSGSCKIAVVWDGGCETELDAEWVFDKVTNTPPDARHGRHCPSLLGISPLQLHDLGSECIRRSIGEG